MPIKDTIINWYKNRRKVYSIVGIEEVKERYKRSDKLFILGGGESINHVTSSQWEFIAKHDSIGMNWWPVHEFIPSFYYTNYPQNKIYFRKFVDILQGRLKKYSNTVFFLSQNRVVRRGIHPRVTPWLFPEMPLCCFYTYNDPIQIDPRKKIFKCEMFEKTLYYRGGLTLVLDLMDKLDYKEIILMGIDLVNGVHFYDYYPQMQWQFETGYSASIEAKKRQIQSTMGTKNNSKVPMDEYIYALNDLYLKNRRKKLFVGSKNSILARKISVFEFPKNAATERMPHMR